VRPLLACLLLAAAAVRAAPDDEPIKAALGRQSKVATYHRKDAAGTPRQTALGRKLFFDKRLSLSGKMSCATCHVPSLGFSDGLPRAVGRDGKPVARGTPSLLNSSFHSTLFWDGRAATIDEAALIAIQNPEEMAAPLPDLTRRLASLPEYPAAFSEAFPGAGVSSTTIGRALGAYVFSLASPEDSAFDKFAAGKGELSAEARRGFLVFAHKAECLYCHSSLHFNYNDRYQNIGLAPRGAEDPGRFRVENNPELYGAFRVPSLRNAARTAPYMHDGRFATLEEVIEFYDRGGDKTRYQDSAIRPLGLSDAEKADLKAFLLSLNSSRTAEESAAPPPAAKAVASEAYPSPTRAVYTPETASGELTAEAGRQLARLERLAELAVSPAGASGRVSRREARAYCLESPMTLVSLPERDRELLYACESFARADPAPCQGMPGAYITRSIENCVTSFEFMAGFAAVQDPGPAARRVCESGYGLNNPRLTPEERVKACAAISRRGDETVRCAAYQELVPRAFAGLVFRDCVNQMALLIDQSGCDDFHPGANQRVLCAAFKRYRAGSCGSDFLCRVLQGQAESCGQARRAAVAAACAALPAPAGGAQAPVSAALKREISETISWAAHLPILSIEERAALSRLHESMLGNSAIEPRAAVADMRLLRAGAIDDLRRRAGSR
jgi:cytochrome c peroxidase